MRPAISHAIVKWMTLSATVLSLLVVSTFSFAQSRAASSGNRTSQPLQTRSAAIGEIQPPATTDTWTGGGSNSNWSNASNWNNGAITTGENLVINLTTAATVDDQSFTIGTLTLSNAGDSVTVNPGLALTVGGNIANNGTINLGTGTSGTELVLAGNVTLSGTGTVTLSNSASNVIFGSTGLDQLTNQETIQGAGSIGSGQMALVNSGTIDGNQSTALTIDVNNGLTNTGTLEATSSGTLIISNTGTVNNTGGKILANTGMVELNNSNVNGGTVTLTGASTLQLNSGVLVGESLTNSATGTIEAQSGTSVLGGTINNSAGGLFEINNGAVLDLQGGTYAQLGKVQLNSTGSFSELVLQGNVTLSGGSVTLSNNNTNYIFGQVGTDTLTNQETISGAGQIGNGQMTLINSGTINANQSAGVGSSRVDLQACKLEYSIVSPK